MDPLTEVRAYIMDFDNKTFLTICDPDTGQLAMPGGPIMPGENLAIAANKYVAQQTHLLPRDGLVSQAVQVEMRENKHVFIHAVLYSSARCPILSTLLPESSWKNLEDCRSHTSILHKIELEKFLKARHRIVPPKSILRRNNVRRPTNKADGETAILPSDEMKEILEFHCLLKATNRYSPVHIDGEIILPGATIPFEKALMDSGAIQANYMSSRFFKKNFSDLQHYSKWTNQTVRLGDSRTQRKITHEITVPVKFLSRIGLPVEFQAIFLVFETDIDIILGLPTLLSNMRDIFMEGFQDNIRQTIKSDKEGFGPNHDPGDHLLHAIDAPVHRETNQPTGPIANPGNPRHSVKIMFVDSKAQKFLMRRTGDKSENLSWLEFCIPCDDKLPPQDIEKAAQDFSEKLLNIKIEQAMRLGYTEGRYDNQNYYSVAHAVLIDVGHCNALTDLTSKYHWAGPSEMSLGPASDLPFKWIVEGILTVVMTEQRANNSESRPFGKHDEEAPEDTSTDLPVQFAFYLSYMETSHEEAVATYFSQFEKQVAPAMLSRPRVKNLLETLGLQVFVPQNWDGVNGLPDLELEFMPSFPTSSKPGARPVNPRLYEHAKKEYNRLKKYMYEKSYSAVASPLVIAPKATAPFIRFCGDYVKINKHIVTHHYPIPKVTNELAKISKWTHFLDLDMANSFHQRKLGPITSARLSIQSPWGLDQPKFMPEGIGPASGYLQEMVEDIFRGFEDFTITIFDNFLVCCDSLDDAEEKLQKILQRCKDRNLFLKFTKSWIGFQEVNFFGYRCKHKSYGLTPERQQSIRDIPFPESTVKMQSFLGMSLFFSSFVPNYSQLTAKLNEMTHKDFNWKDPTVWKHDYLLEFNKLKDSVSKSLELFYPDYDLDWVLRTDASELGVGAALFQIYREAGKEPVYQPISFASKKFSDAATRWSTIEQEAYGIFFGLETHAYFLYAKKFILETDHRNLIWIESSVVPKIVRWRIYMQSFNFVLRHIAGKLNIQADYFSRMHFLFHLSTLTQSQFLEYAKTAEGYPEINDPSDLSWHEMIRYANFCDTNYMGALHQDNVPPAEVATPTPETLLSKVHGGRMAHHGARRTWEKLNQHFPGHKIPLSFVQDYVASCPICQKNRLGMTSALAPVVRHIKPAHQRSAIGIDLLTITPIDERGNNFCVVIVNLFTKLTQIYPVKDATGLSLALCIFQYTTTYGLVDEIHSDPGSDLTSTVVAQLNSWLGIHHVFSLVDRHTSSGVESTNWRILKHLRALVYDERLRDKWSDPSVLPWVQFILNDSDNSETGVKPFVAHFGSADATYHRMPEGLTDPQRTVEFLRLLNDNLHTVLTVSKDYQDRLIEERLQTNSAIPNTYAPGDYILKRTEKLKRPDKLVPIYLGPYEVVHHYKNDITCRHLHKNETVMLKAEDVKPFFGSTREAKQAALYDHDQYTVSEILNWKGDPLARTKCEFLVKWQDGSESWHTWNRHNVTDTLQFEEYVNRIPELTPLRYNTAKQWNTAAAALRKQNVSLKKHDEGYLDLRSYGQHWLDSMQLPNSDTTQYVVKFRVVHADKKKIEIKIPVFGVNSAVSVCSEEWVQCWGQNRIQPPLSTLLDAEFVQQYPNLLI